VSADVHTGARVVSPGNSITARGWINPTGGLLDIINAKLTKVPARNVTGAVLATMVPGSTIAKSMGCLYINTGINEQTIEDIEENVGPQITDHDPDLVVMLIGVNNVAARTDPAVFAAKFTSTMAQIRAWSSTVPIVCVSILCYGEIWAAGPVWNNGVTDTDFLEPFNTTIQAACVTYNATYTELRAKLLAIEPLINPTQANAAFTTEGVHPLIQSSELIMGQWASFSFNVIP
jgi:hypothetical protein